MGKCGSKSDAVLPYPKVLSQLSSSNSNLYLDVEESFCLSKNSGAFTESYKKIDEMDQTRRYATSD